MRRLATILAGSAVLLVIAPVLPADGGAATAWAQALKHNCAFCHNLHGGSYAALRDTAVVEDLCDSCHGVTEAEPDSILRDGTWVTIPKNGGAGFDIHNGAKHTAFARDPTGCWDCHNHEGEAGGNLSMIQANMPTPVSGTLPVIFTSRGTDAADTTLYSFADGDEDGDGDYTGVCEVCHTETSNHQNGLNLPDASNHSHEVGRTCSDCHTHDGGFAGGGPCASCHDTGGAGTQGTNNRRAVIPEIKRPSHHVGASYVDEDCATCHDQSEHQQGQVRLLNADDASVIVYGGTPSDLEPFCLSCHDSDGSIVAGGPPFSDGLTPPDVASGWTSASHNATGGYTCWDCHDNAHGSEKRKLLAPADVAPTAPANTEEEEGFCFNCHSSGGAASTDIQTQFSGSILWVAAAVGDNSNTNLNDRHDVQYAAQTTSGAKIECTDCHDPHAATSAQPWKTDPDPADGRVPGTGQVFAGTDALSEFCMDCHDGSFPSAVTAPITALNSVRDTWATDAMGAGGGSPTLKSGYGWAPGDTMACAACHSPHVSSNLFHGHETILSKDGTTPVPSDGGAGYTLTDNSVKSPPVNGYNWCNTCHTSSMGDKKDNCFACHYHGTRW